jgi:hypothetical protein
MGLATNDKEHVGPVEEGFDFLGLRCSTRDHEVHLAVTDRTGEKLCENVNHTLAERLRETGAPDPTYRMVTETVEDVRGHMGRYYHSAGVKDMFPLWWAATRYESDWLEAQMNERIA